MSTAILAGDGKLYDSETGEALVNEVEQVEVEIVEDTLPSIVCNGGTHIQTNTEQLKKELVIHLKKYDIEVTQETEKDASKLATELNKLAADLNKKRLSVGREIKKPAEALKESIDELIDLVQTKRTNILEGVEKFKSKRFEWIRGLLEQERDKLFADMKVGSSYQFLDIEVLVKESSLGKSKLTKNALELLESMVRRIKALEDAVKIRTLELKVTCIDAGLEYPIKIHQVEAFIKEDDYDDRLKIMIDAQLNVEKQVKEKAEQAAEDRRIDLEKEQDRLKQKEEEKIEVQKVNEINFNEENKRIANEETERLAKNSKKIITLVATFKIEVNDDVHPNNVLDKYETKLMRDFTTLESVFIQ